VRSMTGYGESLRREDGIEVFIQIKTLNHRFLQIGIVCPEEVPWRLERQIEEKIKEKIYRGKVLVNLQISREGSELLEIEPDFSLATLYFNAFKKLKEKLYLKENINLSHLLNFPEIIKIKEKKWDKIEKILQKATDEALGQVIKTRESEGEKHLREILKYIRKIKSSMNSIKKEAPSARKNYREKLQGEMEKAFPREELSFQSNQISPRLALMITKGDISEEIVRFNSHLTQFNRTLGQQKAIGKKLGFILQELQREINTVGAKSLSYNISSKVIQIKDNIEKIREQICNIE